MELILKGVLHVPACGENGQPSAPQLRRWGIFVEFPPRGGATMRYSNSSLVGVAEANGLYVLRPMRGDVLGHLKVNNAVAMNTGKGAATVAAQWHFRLEHLGAIAVPRLSLQDNDIPSIWKVPRCVCTACMDGKMDKKPVPLVLPLSKATQAPEIGHRDIAGPIDPISLAGTVSLLLFTNDFTWYKVGYLLKCKSELFARFMEYKALVEKQQGKVIKKLRKDEGGEYTSNEFCHLLQRAGIEIQRTTAYRPLSNGVSERANHTIIGTMRPLLDAVSAPMRYLATAAMTAIHVYNWLPTRTIQTGFTSYDRWHVKKPMYKHLRVCACVAYGQVLKQTRKKVDNGPRKCIFIG